jgi:alkanesulfonate monooxygenase SsuD/methylene tetrahydromethanopterin reductase-like flavin-dependent oxidoreductase (luciferase family)
MKFHWFHLMPWPDLPDDFKEQHRSVWVDIDYNLYDPVKGNHVYHEYLDELEYAEKVGFDGICVNEHHNNAYGMMPSPNIMAATLTRRTNRAAIVVMGNSIALYNPPIRVAEEFAMLDILSGGRLVAGFPVGTSMDTNFAYGVAPATLRDRYYEAHDLIMEAWHNKDTFHFNGKYNQVRYVNPWPRPLQQPNPPIWIPGGGSIETWQWCADMGYLYSYLSYSGYKRAQNIMDGFWRRMEENGKDFNPYHAGFAQVVCVAETDAEAEKLYAEHVDYFYNRCLHVYGGFADAPGYRTRATLKAGLRSQLDQIAQRARMELTWKNLTDDAYVVAGSPDTVVEKLTELAENLKIGHLMLLMQIGDMPREKVTYNTTMFAEKVMPRLRHLFDEYEDHWYPKMLPADDRATPRETQPMDLSTIAEAVGVGGGD